jgi:hypothetical protein
MKGTEILDRPGIGWTFGEDSSLITNRLYNNRVELVKTSKTEYARKGKNRKDPHNLFVNLIQN